MPTDLFEKLPLKSIPKKVKEEATFGQSQNARRSNVWKWKLRKLFLNCTFRGEDSNIYYVLLSRQSFSINIVAEYFDDRYFKRISIIITPL